MAISSTKNDGIRVKLPTPCGWSSHDDVNINFIGVGVDCSVVVEFLWSTEEWGYILPCMRCAPNRTVEGRC